jgi:AcrR family transcriptional regulator
MSTVLVDADTPTRLTQAERVEAMRARLLDATIDCLVAKGYAELSTNDIVRQAGVSRGALAHHFPAKSDLVAAAAERLIDQAAAEFRRGFAGLPPRRRTVPEALDLLWSYYEGPAFAALLELVVAARTNPELREVLIDGPDRIASTALEVFVELFPQIAGNPMAEPMIRATVALLAGLAVQAVVDGDRHGHHAALRELFKTLGALAVPIGPPA